MTTLTHKIRITPRTGWEALPLRELWEYRELTFFLVWRDVKVRYKRAALGVLWAILQPLTAMLLFTVIFGRLAGLPSEGVPYPLFTLAALLPWQLFATSLASASNSLVGSGTLLRKVYFPRLIIPLASVGVALMDFAVSLLLLGMLMAWYGFVPPVQIVFLPVFVVAAMVTALAIGLWTSALNVRYRDVQYVLPFAMQVLLFASPIAYSAELVPEGPLRIVYGLNPLAGIVQGFRWALLDAAPPDTLLLPSLAVTLLLLVSGLFFFRRMEATFADVV
jgi:lipopolysaccharide transport system permease protein